MNFIYDDGGREAAGFKGKTGDCACRAIAIATQMPYKEVYDLINEYGKAERANRKSRRGNTHNGHRSDARTGVYADTMQITAGISRIADRARCKAQERATAGIQRLCESKGIRRLL